METSPFHRGEQAMQQRAGVRERIEQVGRTIIRDHMPEPHRELFGKLPTLLVGAVDEGGQPWATMLHGPPGFVTTPGARTLRIATLPPADDPLQPLLHEGAAVGLLGLEPQTRRRNRANGTLTRLSPAGFEVLVEQSFGNCPKYIQAREPRPEPRFAATAVASGTWLDGDALALVRGADTLFIASASAARPGRTGDAGAGVDLSHRGGRPGFVQVADTAAGLRLTVPDYPGNRLFNTLGNLLAWPFTGLLFVDHASGGLLHLAARAEVQHEGPELAAHPGAERLLHLHLRAGCWRAAALPLAWSAPQPAPQLLDR